jgi:hypothetical protein
VSDDLSIPNPGYRGAQAGRYGTGLRPRKGMDPDMRRMAMFAGGIGTVLVLLITASALTGRHSGETPVISADTRPIRVKPENPGGMKIDGAENDVFSAGSDTINAKLAPPAETPDTKAWRSPPQAAEAPPVAVEPPHAVIAPARPAVVATPKPAAAKPAAVARAQVAAVPFSAAAPPSTHTATVQLAALTSEEAAHGEWQMLSKRMPDLLGNRQPNYSRTEHAGHAFWRLRTSGFADIAQARSFCEKVRAKGLGCSVADF